MAKSKSLAVRNDLSKELDSEVGRMVDSGQADDRRLIRLVRERPLLYARNTMPVASYYSQVKNMWAQVATHMGWTVADVRRKWSHVRNSYSRHLRNELQGACTSKGRMVSKWYLADELEFLREHMATDTRSAPYPTFSNSLLDMNLTPGRADSPVADPVDVKPFIPGSWFALGSPNNPPLKLEHNNYNTGSVNEDSSSSYNFAPEENSSFFQFFRGLYADYQELAPKNQRKFKRQCLTNLHELLDQSEQTKKGHGLMEEQSNALNLSNSAHVSEDERDVKNIDISPVQIS